jgi:aquaporin Z
MCRVGSGGGRDLAHNGLCRRPYIRRAFQSRGDRRRLGGRRLNAADVIPYWIVQVLDAIAAAAVLYLIASGRESFSLADGFATNGYGDLSPGKYNVVACFVAELVTAFFFLLVILGSTRKLVPTGFAPIPIGLALTLIHLITIPNTSVNPARSIGTALFAGGPHIAQLWPFIIAPLIGAAAAGLVTTGLAPGEPLRGPEAFRPLAHLS